MKIPVLTDKNKIQSFKFQYENAIITNGIPQTEIISDDEPYSYVPNKPVVHLSRNYKFIGWCHAYKLTCRPRHSVAVMVECVNDTGYSKEGEEVWLHIDYESVQVREKTINK